jgi:hypothetical protein
MMDTKPPIGKFVNNCETHNTCNPLLLSQRHHCYQGRQGQQSAAFWVSSSLA